MFMTFSSPSKEQAGRKYSAMFIYRASWARTSFVAEILLASHLVDIRIHHQSHCVWENKLTVSQDWRIKLAPVKCQKHIVIQICWRWVRKENSLQEFQYTS